MKAIHISLAPIMLASQPSSRAVLAASGSGAGSERLRLPPGGVGGLDAHQGAVPPGRRLDGDPQGLYLGHVHDDAHAQDEGGNH